MRKVLLSFIFFFAVLGTIAQQTKKKVSSTSTSSSQLKTPAKRIKGSWQKGGMISLTLAQGGTRNWAPGGDRFSLAGNGFLNLYANHTKGKFQFNTMLDANYGLLLTEAWGAIKNDDKFEVLNKWNYPIFKANKKGITRFRVGLTTNFRTQFADGYDYDGDVRKRISAFLAPGILVASTGIDYVAIKGLNVHFSPFAGRWILVPNRPYELGANYGVDAAQQVKNEFGSYLSVGYTGEIMKNVSVRSRVDFFADYTNKNSTSPDVYLTNMLYFKINNCLGVVYNFDLQYDDNTKIFGYAKNSTGTQLKSIFGMGLSWKW
ncbi:MAG: DUF3078 domain-containing protein [Chitinophagaceae bacterium]|jgi:hypothetical protein|nr:DUF3078 domain-containing protein [Chitinophagaceae bacterium]